MSMIGAEPLDSVYYVAFFLIGVSGGGVFMGALVFTEVYPQLEAIVTSITAAMFDCSSAVFFIFYQLFSHKGQPFYDHFG